MFKIQLYTWSDLISHHPSLLDNMMTDRKIQFYDRLKWDLKIQPNGWEKDQYDELPTTTFIVASFNNKHLGSGRILPTKERSLVGEHFTYLTKTPVQSRHIWEATRLLLSPTNTLDPIKSKIILLKLFQAGMILAKDQGVLTMVAVFDRMIERFYNSVIKPNRILGKDHEYAVGEWDVSDDNLKIISNNLNLELNKNFISELN